MKDRPDYVIFGFTMVMVTLIASKALGIPVLGFVLHPRLIPSAAYPHILPLREAILQKMTQESMREKQGHFKIMKYIMDNTGAGTDTKAALQERRGLQLYKSYETSTWQELKDKNMPLIAPISKAMFGGKPGDWSENTVLTD